MKKKPVKKKAERPLKHFESEVLGVKFDVPERPSIREQLAFQSAAALAEGGFLVRFWYGAQAIIKNWECELLPEPQKLNLDEESNPQIADIVRFVGNEVSGYMTEIGNVPKNG